MYGIEFGTIPSGPAQSAMVYRVQTRGGDYLQWSKWMGVNRLKKEDFIDGGGRVKTDNG